MPKQAKFTGLPESTKIDLIATKGDEVYFRPGITIAEANKIKRRKGWKYYRFQQGFSQFKNVKIKT